MNTPLARCLCGVCVLILTAGCSSLRSSDEHHGPQGAPVDVERSAVGYDWADTVGTGVMAPNADGKTMLITKDAVPGRNPNTEDAFELKLRTRELAAQLFETRDNSALVGLIAMPTSFVNLNDFNESSALGRYLAEAMFYECNQRSFPVREYRLRGNITLREDTGELALSRSLAAASTKQSWAALLIGTYHKDPTAIFVNARLVRPSDGMVLRTAHMVLPVNGLLDRMSTNPPKPPFESGSLRITSRK